MFLSLKCIRVDKVVETQQKRDGYCYSSDVHNRMFVVRQMALFATPLTVLHLLWICPKILFSFKFMLGFYLKTLGIFSLFANPF